ncbi:MAG: DUF3473 domain-containing protein [Alphaproteobacteria bacterium]|nr:MAG: DUF3473 domain-containing protein [Alphaproteobacteria bacterium]
MAKTPIRNAMSVDVEDYFQVQALVSAYDRSNWEGEELRVARNTERLLDLFAQYDVKATFFTLGWIAERAPGTIQRIAAEGHELAAHGYEHTRVFEQDAAAFRADVKRTKAILEDLGGVPVKGYRAATFSMREDVLWAYEVLAEEGYKYSSSVYPIAHDLYGLDEAPRFAFRPYPGCGIVEYPMTTLRKLGRTWPGGGGGYFRIFPYAFSKYAIRQLNRNEAQPYMFYCHPWEIDADQPRPVGVPFKSRLRHYTNLSRMEAKIERLLRDFKWGRVDECFVGASTPAFGEAAQ